ncbi:MAG TPA: hypothetical protein PKK10_02770 [Woeseiaceae bacterium]|nr:hypothetical protein [Woeseiaceae bacterium]
MNAVDREHRLLPGILLAALLVGAQLATVLHAFEHDLGTAQSKVCATCVAAAQLGAAGIDSHPGIELAGQKFRHAPITMLALSSVPAPTARQRGPPPPP